MPAPAPVPTPPHRPTPSTLDDARTRARLEELAAAIGFDALAIATAAPLPAPHPAAYQAFLNHGFTGDMDYLADHPGARLDPTTRWPWAQSVLVLAVHYDRGAAVTPFEYATGYPRSGAATAGTSGGVGADRHFGARSARPVTPTSTSTSATTTDIPLPAPVEMIARYARGRDYHRALDNALRLFKDAVVNTPELGIAQVHYHCDTGPVLERPWAHQAGLGWQAKNGLIIRPGAGSFLFLAELFLDRTLPADAPATDHCGSCTRCIDICPTDAIVADRVIDPRKCIPWLNIEKRTDLAPTEQPLLNGWLFGCDMCQNVCPHNARLPLNGLLATGGEPRHGLTRQFVKAPVGTEIILPWYTHADRPLRKILGPELWEPTAGLQNLTWAAAALLSESEFDALKQGTALRRVPYQNFIVNARLCANYWHSQQPPAATPPPASA